MRQGRLPPVALAVPRALLLALSAMPAAEPWVLRHGGAGQVLFPGRAQSGARQRGAAGPLVQRPAGLCRGPMGSRRTLAMQSAGGGPAMGAGGGGAPPEAPGGGSKADFSDEIRAKGLSAFLYSCHTMEPSWRGRMRSQFGERYFLELAANLKEEVLINRHTVYPPPAEIFSAFQRTPFDSVRVVIVGQDPYHGPGQAEGLSFSVPYGVEPPPSLKNIYTELEEDPNVQFTRPKHGHLGAWAAQGVLLLNTFLTVRENAAASHQKFGWAPFTDSAIRQLDAEKEGLIFALWGAHAHKTEELLTPGKHHVLKSSHPSPFSARKGNDPFIGNRHFSRINEVLREQGKPEIDWQL